MSSTPALVSRKEAAARLGGVSVKTVDRMRASLELDTRPVRGRKMVTVASIDRFLGLSDPDQPAPKKNDGWDGFEIPGLDDDEDEDEDGEEPA